jgi:hypothetical protein
MLYAAYAVLEQELPGHLNCTEQHKGAVLQ